MGKESSFAPASSVGSREREETEREREATEREKGHREEGKNLLHDRDPCSFS